MVWRMRPPEAIYVYIYIYIYIYILVLGSQNNIIFKVQDTFDGFSKEATNCSYVAIIETEYNPSEGLI